MRIKKSKQSPAEAVVPTTGVEWQILDKTTEQQMASWKGTVATYRGQIDKVRKRDIELRLTDRNGKPLARRTVRVVQTKADFHWGFGGWGLINSIRTGKLAELGEERIYRAKASLFNAINLMHYWVEKFCDNAPVSEEFQGFPDYDSLDKAVNWAMANHLTPKGHPIFWPVDKAIPDWLAKYDNATRLKFLEVRVRTIASRFRGRMKLYDAVNEMMWEPVFADTHKRHWPHISKISRIADDVERVIGWAREEDPDAAYLVNEYSVVVGDHEKIPVKCHDGSYISKHEQAHRYAALVHELKKRGCAPDAIGIQNFHGSAHMDANIKTLQLLGQETGLPVHITEFGPGEFVGRLEKAGTPKEKILERVWEYCEAMMTVAYGHPSVEGLFYWYGTHYLFNQRGYPSDLYKRFDALLNKTWRTDETLRTDADGRVSLRGFCGDYRVRLQPRTNRGQEHGVGFSVPQSGRGKVKLGLMIGE